MDLSKVRTGSELQPACETNSAQGFFTSLKWFVLICVFNILRAVETAKNSCSQLGAKMLF